MLTYHYGIEEEQKLAYRQDLFYFCLINCAHVALFYRDPILIDTHSSPFNLDNTEAYKQWRETKLSNTKTNPEIHRITLNKTPPHFLALFNKDNDAITNCKESILNACATNNYYLYAIENYTDFCENETKQLIQKLTSDCGLTDLDQTVTAEANQLSDIQKTTHAGQHEYIPYTNKALSWHTDGYYNTPDKRINSMSLHCYSPSKIGGESAFLDHEIAYILLRDENPDWIKALSKNNVLTIPANILNGKTIREAQTGPVFSVTANGHLHMRYSARSKNILWKQDAATQDALKFLSEHLNSDSNYIIRYKFKAGEGIICRNILHCRSEFEDQPNNQQRLLFRGRFYNELRI